MKNNKLTLSDKVIISCYKTSSDHKKFSAEDLAVKCFELYPENFSLKGYKYPDSNRVYTNIMTSDSPIIKNGWLIKLGEKMYKISDTGISYVENILQTKTKKGNSHDIKQSISRDILRKFLSFYKNPVIDKIIKKKNLDSVDFDEISYLWSITSNIRYPELISKLSEIDTWIDTINKEITDKNNSFILDKGVSVTKKDLLLIKDAQKFFIKKFKSEIDYIKETRKNSAYS